MSDDGNFFLSWGLHEQERTSALNYLWKNENFLDVTIACDDDQIDAHKVILSASSPFFQNILKRNPHSHPLLYLRGTRKNDILALLEFIYTGETQVLQDELEEFMALANSLEVKGLVGQMSDTNDKKLKDPVNNSQENGQIVIKQGLAEEELNTAERNDKTYFKSSNIEEKEAGPTFQNNDIQLQEASGKI